MYRDHFVRPPGQCIISFYVTFKDRQRITAALLVIYKNLKNFRKKYDQPFYKMQDIKWKHLLVNITLAS